jgi:hypothetical protein
MRFSKFGPALVTSYRDAEQQVNSWIELNQTLVAITSAEVGRTKITTQIAHRPGLVVLYPYQSSKASLRRHLQTASPKHLPCNHSVSIMFCLRRFVIFFKSLKSALLTTSQLAPSPLHSDKRLPHLHLPLFCLHLLFKSPMRLLLVSPPRIIRLVVSLVRSLLL